MTGRVAFVSAALLTLAFSNASAAQEHVGVRAGISGDPDHFVFGGHIETSPLLDRLVFRPNAEIGVGDDLVLIAFNLEFAYKIPLEDNPWTVYVEAGPALNILSFSDDGRRRRDDTKVEGGFNILLGAEHDGRSSRSSRSASAEAQIFVDRSNQMRCASKIDANPIPEENDSKACAC